MQTVTTMLMWLMLGGTMPLLAETAEIDAQIEAILTAKESERHQLMNAFKQRLSEMNARDRADAIAKLRAQSGNGAAEGAHERQENQERFQVQQMQQIQQRQQVQSGSQQMMQNGSQQIMQSGSLQMQQNGSLQMQQQGAMRQTRGSTR